MLGFDFLDSRPIVVALAGSNGAGKSTFFESHLSECGLRFVNADEIAGQLAIGPYQAAEAAAAIRASLIVGLDEGDQTVEKEGIYDGLEIDLVTHDASKFFALMLRRNGYVLEQIFSPLVVFATKEFDELKSIAADCVTKHHAHHYLGFAATQWKLFGKESPPRVKPLLYVYRALLTGIQPN
ncbi:putative nucleotidyltransferase [Rubripirellula tenax]|uniref:Putative nucleotidyltransferase n=1 Tax=Rubripirellula tenax TaxID=2528015 RepID=A0A5C6EZA2_9BACT|nr:putative nucleotidyltransferase [Rubripirellula tenax]